VLILARAVDLQAQVTPDFYARSSVDTLGAEFYHGRDLQKNLHAIQNPPI
jgi:hypothetical protein